jgi:hypothetical protein|nr:MAG TPA: helix-turn-helix domain protein [Bacteriophage sp.]
MRIKEILKEKGITLSQLADTMGVSRQALSRQVAGKLLVEKAEEIADALNVPMWQLFASPEEVAGSGEFIAFVKDGVNIYHAESWQELEKLISVRNNGNTISQAY